MYPVKLLSLLLTLVLIFSCDKKDPEPPKPPAPPMLTEATQTGKHTLSFMLNDEVWISQTGWRDLEASISVASKHLQIGSQGPTGYFSMSLQLNEWSPYIYIYSEHENKGRKGFFTYGSAPNQCFYFFEASPLDSFNVVEITHLETSQTNAFDQWISGTFQFRMIEENEGGCGDTIYITDGRFDVRYQAK